jgi:hypothetical protein
MKKKVMPLFHPLLPRYTQSDTVLPSESGGNVLSSELAFDGLIDVDLVDDGPKSFSHVQIPGFACSEDLHHKVATETGIIGIAEMLVDTLLQVLNTSSDFLGIMSAQKLLGSGTRMRWSRSKTRWRGPASLEEILSRFNEVLNSVSCNANGGWKA